MKHFQVAAFAALISASSLLAQSPTWAKQLHKTKTGIWPAGVEQRLKAEKQAREQQRQGKVTDLFALLDHDRDGAISAREWRQATQDSAPAPNESR